MKTNEKKIADLKAEYVRLYWQGLDPDKLQAHVKDDFARLKIVYCNPKGFAEIAIYESIMKN